MDADNGAYVSSVTHRIIKNRKWLIIAELETQNTKFYVIEDAKRQVHYDQGVIHINKLDASNFQINPNPLFALIDNDKIQFPLLLRKPRAGDYFYPLGMEKKKKINRFLIDLKLSKTQKENCWVLESNKKIVWVIGYRIDNRFKLQEPSRNILQLQLWPTNF